MCGRLQTAQQRQQEQHTALAAELERLRQHAARLQQDLAAARSATLDEGQERADQSERPPFAAPLEEVPADERLLDLQEFFKYKKRKHYRRTRGHRQHVTAVRIDAVRA